MSQRGAEVVSEAAPTQLTVRQGSLWGVTPKSAKKIIYFTFEPTEDTKTRVEYSSKVAAEWKYTTVIGCVLAVVLAGVCLWMATDLGTFLVTQQPSVWSWLITLQGTIEFQAGNAIVTLTYGLAFFLFIVVASEVAIYVNVHS
jgi:sterol desaturase/sphingolipid hydroxylase (fatty acid hydroxylase superfamily)